LERVQLGNDVALELSVGADGTFGGVGAVEIGGVAMRSPRRPWFVEVRTPDAWELGSWRVVGRQESSDALALTMEGSARAAGIMEWMVHEVRNRHNTADWSATPQPAPDTQLQWKFTPAARRFGQGGRWEATGFTYQFGYRSARYPIYRILEHGTWEPGGAAVGNEIWMRNCFVPSIVPLQSPEQFHATEWYLPDCANPNVFQFLPLQTELQGFTFTPGPRGTLITWATRVAHVRTLLQKPGGVDEIEHWHEHCGDLSPEFTTSPMEVLWVPGGLDRTDRFNLYEAVKELVHDTLHVELGMRRERIVSYGMIEEWGPADLERFARLGLPKLLAAGARKVYVANHFQNNMNTWGVSNMCCTVDYQVAESVGADKLTAFCRQARAGGAKVEMWANSSISVLTEIFRNRNGTSDRIRFLPLEGSIAETLATANAPFTRNASNAIEADHYTPIFAVLNLRDPDIRAYWLRRWRQAHDEVGLEGIFLDSSFNLSSDKFHWVQNAHYRTPGGGGGVTADQTHLLGFYRPAQEPPAAILSQYRAHLELMVEMQGAGYEYCNEDLGVFGLHRHGPGVQARLDSLPLWSECICEFDAAAIRAAPGGYDPEDVFFRGLAYRMVWPIHWDPQKDALSFHYGGLRSEQDRPSDRHLALLRAFNEVSPWMRRRTVLPEDRGVLYEADSPSGEGRQAGGVLFAFQDHRHDLPPRGGPMKVCDVLDGGERTLSAIDARRQGIYVYQ